MAKKKETSLETILTASLQLAAKRPWAEVKLQDIAKKAKISLAALHGIVGTKDDILAAYGERVDGLVLERMQGRFSAETSEREKLFDILMERFDILNENREAAISMAESVAFVPSQVVTTLPHIMRSMLWTLEAVEADVTGWQGYLCVVGLTGVYLYALKTFIDDESADLGKTMAALDKALNNSEKIADFFNL